MKKTSKKSAQGFTLIEVLVAVAVMGFLVYAAINFVSGDTQKANFTVSINDFKQSIEQFINETTNGYYPNKSDFSCSGNTDGATPPTFTSSSPNGQGQNYNCIFLGKVILFAPNSGQYSVYPVVGNQFDFQQSPTTIYGLSTGTSPDIPIDSTSGNPYSALSQTLQNGLTIQAVTALYGVSSQFNPAAIGFLVGDANGNIAGYNSGNLNSGAEPLSLYYDSVSPLNTIPNFTKLNADVETINGLSPAKEVDICAAAGNQSGKIIIGDATTASSSASNLGVTLKIYNDGTCT